MKKWDFDNYLSSSFFSSSNLFYSFFSLFFLFFLLFLFSQPQDHFSDLSFLIWTIFKFEDLTQFFIHSSLSEMLNDVKSFYLFLEWQPCHSSVLVLSLPGKFTQGFASDNFQICQLPYPLYCFVLNSVWRMVYFSVLRFPKVFSFLAKIT